MTEIYWLQRLVNISIVFNVGFWACVIVAVVLAIILFFVWLDDELDKKDILKRKRYLKRFAYVFAFFTIGVVFIPTQKELLAIYGLGGTIDYIKSNDKARQLPDKCIDALTRYVDSIEKENEKENEKDDNN